MSTRNLERTGPRAVAQAAKGPRLVPRRLTGWDYLMGLGVFAVSLGLYVYTLSPGICAGDSGELTSAVFFLGNAHSPGYPLYCVVGKFFMNMLPFLGRAVYRLNFFSAFGGALTVAGLFLVLVKLFGRAWEGVEEVAGLSGAVREWVLVRLPALAGSLYLLFSDELWAQSVISEVYTLNSLFVPVFFLILLKWDETAELAPSVLGEPGYWWNPASRMLYAFWFLLAFSLGDHHIMLGVVLPTFFFILSRYLTGRPLRWVVLLVSLAYFAVLLGTINVKVPTPVILGLLAAASLVVLSKDRRVVTVHLVALVFVALGLLIYVYMPIRGAAYAPVHWGLPTTWERFSAVVLRKQYQGFAQAGELLSPRYRVMQFLVWFKWLVNEFSWPVFLLVVPGLVHLWRRDRRVFWFTVSFVPYYVFGLLIFNNFKFTPRDEFFAEVFWIPFYTVTALWLAYGVRYGVVGAVRLAERLRRPGLAPKAAWAVAVLGVLWSGFTFRKNFADNNLRNNWENDYYGLNMLLTCEPKSILFTEGGDNQVFSLLYHHLVEHLRPDMRIWDQKGNVFEGLYGDLMRITAQQLQENYILGDFTQWDTGRPIYYTWKDHGRIAEINRRFYENPGLKSISYSWIEDGRRKSLVKSWGQGVVLPRRVFETVGILYRIRPENEPFTPRIDYWGHYKFVWRKYPEQARRWDYLAREIIANYNFQLGDRYLQEADEFRAAYARGLPSWRGVPRSRFLERIEELEAKGFSYYDQAAWFGYDMVAIHFNFGIYLEQKAVDHFQRGRREKALEYMRRAVGKYAEASRVDPEEVRAYINLAAAYERLAGMDAETNEARWLEQAKRTVERSRRAGVRHPHLDMTLQRVTNKLKHPPAKLREWERRVNADPKDREALDALLQALLERGEAASAERLLELAVRHHPSEWRYWATLANLRSQAGNLRGTAQVLERLAALQPGNASVWFNLGEVYLRMNDRRRAVESYRRAVALGGQVPQFQREVAEARKRLVALGAAP